MFGNFKANLRASKQRRTSKIEKSNLQYRFCNLTLTSATTEIYCWDRVRETALVTRSNARSELQSFGWEINYVGIRKRKTVPRLFSPVTSELSQLCQCVTGTRNSIRHFDAEIRASILRNRNDIRPCVIVR